MTISLIRNGISRASKTSAECLGWQDQVGTVQVGTLADLVIARHQVSRVECEELFFNAPLIVAPDVTHCH
jgi:N-acetylglucosamine-6-phosphate deacetylase